MICFIYLCLYILNILLGKCVNFYSLVDKLFLNKIMLCLLSDFLKIRKFIQYKFYYTSANNKTYKMCPNIRSFIMYFKKRSYNTLKSIKIYPISSLYIFVIFGPIWILIVSSVTSFFFYIIFSLILNNLFRRQGLILMIIIIFRT